MIVKMQDRGRSVINLHISARNVQRCFRKNVSNVRFELDSVQIQFDRGRDLGQSQAEVVDPGLCAWLAAEKAKLRTNGDTTILYMLPVGEKLLRQPTKKARGAAESSPLCDPAA